MSDSWVVLSTRVLIAPQSYEHTAPKCGLFVKDVIQKQDKKELKAKSTALFLVYQIFWFTVFHIHNEGRDKINTANLNWAAYSAMTKSK